jgi:hypothetical protein
MHAVVSVSHGSSLLLINCNWHPIHALHSVFALHAASSMLPPLASQA